MTICESIKKRYIRLSKGQRKVAQYVIDNPSIVATHVASEVGRLAGVSESTVIRFCYAMSLSGYSELQEKMKIHILEKDGIIPVLPKTKHSEQQQTQMDAVLSKDMKELLTIVQRVDVEQYNNVVQALHDAQNIYIVGLNEALPIAFSAYYDLKKVRNNVQIIQDDVTKTAEQLLHMNHQCVVVAVCLEGQQSDLVTLLDGVKRKNVPIITLTNHASPKLKRLSEQYFDLNKQGNIEDGTVAMYAVVRAIIKCYIESYKLAVDNDEKSTVNKLLIEVS